jgi:hypothetical protein
MFTGCTRETADHVAGARVTGTRTIPPLIALALGCLACISTEASTALAQSNAQPFQECSKSYMQLRLDDRIGTLIIRGNDRARRFRLTLGNPTNDCTAIVKEIAVEVVDYVEDHRGAPEALMSRFNYRATISPTDKGKILPVNGDDRFTYPRIVTRTNLCWTFLAPGAATPMLFDSMSPGPISKRQPPIARNHGSPLPPFLMLLESCLAIQTRSLGVGNNYEFGGRNTISPKKRWQMRT